MKDYYKILGVSEDASADDVEDSDRRERLQTACAVGRRGVSAACGWVASALQEGMARGFN